MNSRARHAFRLALAFFLLLLGGLPAVAQTVTTGSLVGVVTDTQGGVLPGATVTAVHTATGTSYEAVADAEGRFVILNTRVGRFDLTANMSGFRPEKLSAIEVKLGEQATVSFKLQVAAVTETIEVTGESSPIDPSRAGTTDRVSSVAIDSLPTISRSLTDMARTSAYFNPIGLNEDTLAVSVAGRNNRYNNVQIDGAVNNDVFGISVSGTPGGQTETQPISLDAIQELQLVVSPYDVRLGGFSGGGINAITKSGTNRFSGTGYFFGRNQDLIGEGVSRTPVAKGFKQQQMGGSVGGRLIENKAFFFTNADFERRDTPSGFSISTTGQAWGREAEIDRFLNILQTKYGYDPGGKEEFIRTINSDKLFVRGDFNLTGRHQLVARHNLTDSLNDIGRPTATRYVMPDGFYRINNSTNSTVVQLNSAFGTAVNEVRFTLQTIQDRRGAQPFEEKPFPFIQVDLSGNANVVAGRENFSTANELDQDVYELSDDFTWLMGKHTLTLGTKNEFFKFRNLFIRNSFGNYRFASLDLFEQGLAQSFDYDFSLTGDPLQAARFRVRQFGFYAGDQWRPAGNFTLTMGVRADIPTFPDRPSANPNVEAAIGLRTDVVPSGVLWSPRVGFNYAVSDANREQVRGGVGLFAGRTPYVWLSNQYGNTGVEFRRLSRGFSTTQPSIPFVADANAQPRTVGGAVSTEVDVIDPDYSYPSLLRGNLAYDRALPFLGLVGTAEFLYSQNINDIKYQNLNLVQRGTRNLDGRPFFTRDRVAGITDLIFLTNTDQGNAWSLAFKVERPYRDRFFWNASYLYGESRSIVDGTSSQAASNWNGVYVPGDPNNPPLARSNFDPGHRLTMSGGYDIPMPAGLSARVAVFYSSQSGRPWSLLYAIDANGDQRTTNDLMYIPTASDNLTYTNNTLPASYDDLLAFVNAEPCLSKYIGRIHERNACRAPRINTFDLKFNVGLPVRRAKVELTWDILNLLNLIDPDSGVLRYANFNDLLVARPVFNSANQVTGYDLRNLFLGGVRQTPEEQFTRNDLLSRWQMQFGARVRF